MKEINNELWKIIIDELEEHLYGPLGIEKSVLGNISGDFLNINIDAIVESLKKLNNLEKIQNGLTDFQKEKLELLKSDFLDLNNGKNGIQEIYYQFSLMYKSIEEY